MSSLLLVLMAVAASIASADRQTYVVHMDKNKVAALNGVPGDSRKWYEAVIDSITELSAQGEGGEEETSAPQLLYAYETALTGFAAKLSIKQLESLNKVEGFVSAVPDELLSLHTTHTPQFLGLHFREGLWNAKNLASDVIIGVVDTGVWPEHVSFRDRGLPPVPSRWKGACEQGISFNISNCNKKLIGAKAFLRGFEARTEAIDERVEPESARDSVGHGTHTAATAAGNIVPGASIFGMARGIASGMTYTSRIAIYKACFSLGCSSADVLAAMDQAVSDGVDVLSLSLGASARPYYMDVLAIGSLGAVKHGIFVAFSAGNSGPSESSVINGAPWVTTVAASSTDRTFSTIVKLGSGESFRGASLHSGSSTGQLLLVYGETVGGVGARNCSPGTLSPGMVKGKIVVCERLNRKEFVQGEQVRMAGGAGMVLLNSKDQGEEIKADPHILPATSVGASAAKSIVNYVATSKNPTASIVFKGAVYGDRAPVIASFSSRGPALEPYVIKPDVTAPGVSILAAWPPIFGPSMTESDNRSVLFNSISGTSMSCPHVSGLAALLKSLHKDWSPAAIKSALMTTAYTLDNKKSPISEFPSGSSATPFAYGSGHVDPGKASDPGLVYDLTHEDYLNYLCSLGYTPSQMARMTRGSFTCPSERVLQPGDLNYPSFAVLFDRNNAQYNSVTHERTVTNVGRPTTYAAVVYEPEGVSVMVEPRVLKFRHLGEKLSYKVSFVEVGETSTSSDSSFGSLVWVSRKYTVRSPIAITWIQPSVYQCGTC